MFDKIVYAQKLCDLADIDYPDNDDLANRELHITVAYDNYAKPSSVIIAFNGSSPRLEVYFRVEKKDIIVVGNKIFRLMLHYDRFVRLHAFLLETFNALKP